MSASFKSSTQSKTGSESSGGLSKIINFKKSVERGTFGVLYTMTKNNTFPRILTIISIIIEFIQLISFGFKSIVPWGGDVGYYLKRIVSPVSHPADVLSYHGFTILFWVAISLMMLGFINIWFVAYQFYQGKIANVWIIRTLRWFVSFTVAVLYIPLVSLFLIGLNCSTNSEGVQVLARFTEQHVQCYGTQNIVVTIFSIFYIIIFTLIAVSSSLTYYEYDTTVENRFAKPHARFDLAILIIKTIYAFFFELLKEYPWLLVIVFFLGMLFITFGSIIILPYNNQRLNQVKSGLYTVILWVSLCSMFTMGVNDTTSPATAYVVITGLIPSFFVGFFGAKYFYKFLYSKLKYLNKMNGQQTTTIHTLEMIGESMNNNKKDPSQRVKFEEPTTLGTKRQLSFPFFAKIYSSPLFVEIMSRRLLAKGKDAEAIEKCNLLYQCALQYYPSSSMLWMAYANFLFTVRCDRHVGYAALEKLRRLDPPFDIRFYIFSRDKNREQMMDSDLRGPDSQGKIQDFVTYMEFKKLYLGARRRHQSCLHYIRRFWRHLLCETIDLHILSDLSGKIARTETRAAELYERLLGLNPNSVRVIRDYAQFTEEIVRDNDMAFKLRKKADLIEDNMSRSLSIEHLKSGAHAAQEDDGTLSENGVRMDSVGASGNAKVNNDTQERSKSGDDTSDTSSSFAQRHKSYEAFQQSNAISKLSWLMILTTLATVVFSIVVLVIMRGQLVTQHDTYQAVLSIGTAATEAVTLATLYSSMRATDWTTQPAEMFLANMTAARRRTNILENIHHAVYYGEKHAQPYVTDQISLLKRQAGIPNMFDVGSYAFTYDEFNHTNAASGDQLDALYNHPSINMSMLVTSVINTGNDTNPVMTTVNELVSQPYNMWRSGNYFVENARFLNTLNSSAFDQAYTNPNYRFIVENAGNMARVFLDLQEAYVSTMLSNIKTIGNTIMIVWACIFVALFLMGALLFRPIVSRISREKIRTLILFSLAPLDLVQKMASKKIKMASLDSGSDRDIQFDTSDDEILKRRTHSDSEFNTVGGPDQDNHTGIQIKDDQSVMSKHSSKVTASVVGEELRPLLSTGTISESNNNINNNNISSPSSDPLNVSGETKVTIGGWDGQSKRNINKRSLRSVLRRLHVSYGAALFMLFSLITIGLFVSLGQVNSDTNAGYTLADTTHRMVNARILYLQITEILHNDHKEISEISVFNDTTMLQTDHQSTKDIGITHSLMDGSYGCWMINKTQCRPSTDPFYNDISAGLDWVLWQFIHHSLNIAKLNPMFYADTQADIQWVKNVVPKEVFDGLDRSTVDYFLYWQASQEQAILILTAVMSVATVLLVLCYLIIFRPFITRLRIQHIHTLAMLRLAPTTLQFMEVSDKLID